jgi:hypothetical protein
MQAAMEAERGRLREQEENKTRRLKQIIERLQRWRWLRPAHHRSLANQRAIPSGCGQVSTGSTGDAKEK